MSWASRDIHQRKQWTYPPNTTCEYLSQTRYSDWQAELNAVASISMTIFWLCHCFSHQHSWLKRGSNQLMYTTEMIKGKTQTVSGPITCLMTSCLAPNSWSRHFLSVIITTFLDYTRRVVPSSKMSMLSRSVRFVWSVGSNRARNHAHFVSRNHSHAWHISHDYHNDHRQKMSRPSD